MIFINNGFNKFHLAPAASELAKRELLSAFSTGAYPRKTARKCLQAMGLAKNHKVRRLLGRVDPIPDNLVFPDWISESLHVFGMGAKKWNLTRAAGEWADERSFKWYGRRAQKIVPYAIENGARLYHYRAGFGGESVSLARSRGLFTLCDHSIAHPAMLEQLVAEGGEWPATAARSQSRSRLWQHIQRDIEKADAVLVNSDFVKETFLHQGWDANRVHVIYLGVDDSFFSGLTKSVTERVNKGDPTRIIFAGSFEQRKGASVLAAAMQKLMADKDESVEFHIAGGVGRDAKEQFHILLHHPKVHYHGILPREDLASLLESSDIFVFPSLAEGSARVVFEALGAGCYVVTTPNSGSIVKDGIHGSLVRAGDSEALVASLRKAISLGRDGLQETGIRNARIIREQYRQSQYGDKLAALYSQLLGAA